MNGVRDMPSDVAMRYFTPDLFKQINSRDEKVVERAQVAWESAISEYQVHLDSIREGMPTAVRQLSSISLHDWDVVPIEDAIGPQPATIASLPPQLWLQLAVIPIRHEEQMIVLLYTLWDQLRTLPPINEWPFTTVGKHWLYDELDAVKTREGLYLHRILFSDGSVSEIPFSGCSLIRFPSTSSAARGVRPTSDFKPKRKLA